MIGHKEDALKQTIMQYLWFYTNFSNELHVIRTHARCTKVRDRSDRGAHVREELINDNVNTPVNTPEKGTTQRKQHIVFMAV